MRKLLPKTVAGAAFATGYNLGNAHRWVGLTNM
jgi:hypothetical protein